jgi:predicted ester cyclase
MFNQHDSGKAADFMTGDIVWHGAGLGDIAGPENLAGLRGSFIGVLPDLYAADQDIIAENDLVVVRLVVTSTIKESLLEAPADGRPVRWDAVQIYRVTDGKISEEWAADDVAAIMAQISAFNPPWAA